MSRAITITQQAIEAANGAVPMFVKIRDAFTSRENSVTFEYIANYQRISILGGFVVLERGERRVITVRGKPAFIEYVSQQLNAPGSTIKQLPS
jgi:hypothetical protein